MLFEEYYCKQFEIQRDINKNMIEKFKEIEITIADNNKEIYNEINNIKSEKLYSYNPINYILVQLFFGFMFYQGVYYMNKN
jgi:hypothetical protein